MTASGNLPDLSALATIVGAENLLTDMDSRQRAVSSWSPIYAKEKDTDSAPTVAAVVLPGGTESTASVVRWANETRTPLYPLGGGSNFVGSTEPATSRRGVAVNLSRLQRLDWDEESLLVRAGAGLTIGEVERQLNGHDYTLGVLPQSLNLLTVGGAITSNAIGVFSGKYGRQSDATLSLTAVLPTGSVVETRTSPLGSAYFDLQRLLIGSEGVFGIVTEAALRMHPVPEARAWAAFTFATFDDGIDALRLVNRSDARVSTARLLDAAAANRPKPLLLLAFEGDEIVQTGNFQLAYAVCQQLGGTAESADLGDRWFDERRASIGTMAAKARAGGISDIFSVAAPYSSLKAVHGAMRRALTSLVTAQSSEIVYADANGAALDVAFEAQANPAAGPEATIALYERIVDAVLDACLEAGGSVAHHYGVGRTRRKHFATERGPEYMAALRAIKAALDPNDILHPGRLI